MGYNDNKTEEIQVPLPKSKKNELFAVVDTVLGGSRMSVACEDGKSRLARIPGGKRRRIGRIRGGDLLIICPWDVQDEKADVVYRYRTNQARFLSRRRALPEQMNVF